MLLPEQEITIKLLGRIAFKKDDIVKIVTRKKGSKSQNYLNGYNACNGKNTLTQIARIIGVTPQTLSPILKEWEEEGIVYTVEKVGGKFYLRHGTTVQEPSNEQIGKLYNGFVI